MNENEFFKKALEIKQNSIIRSSDDGTNEVVEHAMRIIEPILESMVIIEPQTQITKSKSKFIITLVLTKVCILDITSSAKAEITIIASILAESEKGNKQVIYSGETIDVETVKSIEGFLLKWYQSIYLPLR